ncbi:MAG: UDP-N-acetylmuramoyl-tripeptide--D-alanyl-D-alanine ligase [Nitrospirae bacterium]|nr:MAG: UDP-N-acetylmuramoyl-tripeptide--D-alanyl-D-alanine ligase [Nitrospirota bacterium]
MFETEVMGALTVEDIIKATGGKVVYSNGNSHVFTGVSIDSRAIKEGELFVALRGSKFDGHDFLYKALEKGSGALVNFPPAEPPRGKTLIYVKNTLNALQDIAHYMRMRSNIPVIGVTGTNGKTTTKELIASILGTRHRVLKNTGNLNNQIGLPLSLTKISEEDEIAVLEMGASIPGDIKELCGIAAPDYGVVTNIGPGHLEGFGSIEAVRDTKLEILDTVKAVVAGADDAFLMQGLSMYHGKVVTFGIENDADIFAKDINIRDKSSDFLLCLGADRSIEINMNIPGTFNIYNALAAAAIGDIFRMDLNDIKTGIESFKGVPMRLEIKELFGTTVISDVYNANPASMEEAIKELVRLKKGRAIAVLGDMLELGSYAEEAHRKLGEWMSKLPIDIFIAVGPLMAEAESQFSKGGGQSFRAATASEAGKILIGICREEDTVLVKGSRGMGMEKVLEINKVGTTCNRGTENAV